MTAALALTGISKAFDGSPALDEADFAADYGELHGLLGENGAGKSSLMNVACGLYAPDRGRVLRDGVAVAIQGPRDARRLGIGMVHQNFKLVRPFTVAENVLLANPDAGGGRNGLARAVAEVERYCGELGFALDPAARVDAISVSEQQRVEIIKVLMGGARVLILDEPTAVLTDEEADRLLAMARDLAGRGTCVILITHKLREVSRFADKVTVMRRGRTVAVGRPADLDAERLTELMVGAAVRDDGVLPAHAAGEVRLDVRALVAIRDDGAPTLNGVSIAVKAGEIYGIAGVGGNGQPELAEVLMGVRAATAGAIAIGGRDVTAAHVRSRRRAGLASVPADRYVFGLAADLSVTDNYAVGGLDNARYGGSYWVATGRMRSATREAIGAFEIQGAVPATRARLLSGGNAQKLVLARELAGEPKVILAHSPTRGLDVRACGAVHAHLRAARDQGAAVLLISEDLDEVLALSDRIGVMNRGRIVAEFARPADRHAVGRAMVDHA